MAYCCFSNYFIIYLFCFATVECCPYKILANLEIGSSYKKKKKRLRRQTTEQAFLIHVHDDASPI